MLKKYLILMFFLAPLITFAVNDVSFTADTDFEIMTSDTATSTTITALSGSEATELGIASNYIDITIDNLSSVDFTVSTPSRYFKITKQSGSDDYTIAPACPQASVTLTGTGTQTILRLEIQTTNPCPDAGGGDDGGGGGGGTISGSKPKPVVTTPIVFTTPTDCQAGDLFSRATGASCLIASDGCTSFTKYSPLTGRLCPIVSLAILTSSFNFTRNLTLGAVGEDVRALQAYLNTRGFTVSVIGPGSQGNESTYFGLKTRAALKSFQESHKADILTPLGLVSGTGYFGSSTRAYINLHP